MNKCTHKVGLKKGAFLKANHIYIYMYFYFIVAKCIIGLITWYKDQNLDKIQNCLQHFIAAEAKLHQSLYTNIA